MFLNNRQFFRRTAGQETQPGPTHALTDLYPWSVIPTEAGGMGVTPVTTKTVLTEMMLILMADSTIYWAFLAFLPLHYSAILSLFP